MGLQVLDGNGDAAELDTSLVDSKHRPLHIGVANGDPAGTFRQVTDVSAAVGLPSIPVGATIAIVQAETTDVRWRDDGANPTAAVGMLLPAGVEKTFAGNLAALLFIETVASAKLNISYYK